MNHVFPRFVGPLRTPILFFKIYFLNLCCVGPRNGAVYTCPERFTSLSVGCPGWVYILCSHGPWGVDICTPRATGLGPSGYGYFTCSPWALDREYLYVVQEIYICTMTGMPVSPGHLFLNLQISRSANFHESLEIHHTYRTQ